MLIAYDSRTGNVARFINKLNRRAVRINGEAVLSEPFVLVTYTTGFGQIPDATAQFLRKNGRWLRGVASSGNRNWGDGFAKSADRIAEQYRIPVLSRFELSGSNREVEHFLQQMDGLTAAQANVREPYTGASAGGAI